jgi:hypothetical protein
MLIKASMAQGCDAIRFQFEEFDETRICAIPNLRENTFVLISHHFSWNFFFHFNASLVNKLGLNGSLKQLSRLGCFIERFNSVQ